MALRARALRPAPCAPAQYLPDPPPRHTTPGCSDDAPEGGAPEEKHGSAVGCCCHAIPLFQTVCTAIIIAGLVVFFAKSGQAFGAVNTLMSELKIAGPVRGTVKTVLSALLGAGVAVVFLTALLSCVATVAAATGKARRYRMRRGAKSEAPHGGGGGFGARRVRARAARRGRGRQAAGGQEAGSGPQQQAAEAAAAAPQRPPAPQRTPLPSPPTAAPVPAPQSPAPPARRARSGRM